MKALPQNVQLQPLPMLNAGMRMAQIGFDQFHAALGLQAQRIEGVRAATQHACDALLQAPANDAGSFLQAWQTMLRESLAANVALWEHDLALAAQSQAAFGALLRDMVSGFEQAWMRVPSQAAQAAGTASPAEDWLTYFGHFVGGRANGEARLVKLESARA